jgi:hypothetical protein
MLGARVAIHVHDYFFKMKVVRTVNFYTKEVFTAGSSFFPC